MSQEKKPFSRLAKDVVPSNYSLRLKPDIKAFTFEGTEDITIQTLKATKSLVLNSSDIKVHSVTFKGDGQEFASGIEVSYSEADETVTFAFPEELQVGAGKLSVKFSGQLNDKMKGFYRSKYFSPSGEERHGAVTQFEPTFARQAFPCWDEPAIKATFDVTLVVPADRVALSNMPVKKEAACETDAALKVVEFDRTPIMSSYLLAFVVGEYDYVEGKDSDGVLVRVYTPVGKKEQGKFALEVAIKTLPFYNKYFNIAYPLPKMDLIAIADFAAGAMENWGLVTYRETALLVDPENSSASSKQTVALVVGHEIAHQWFGNLVTMEWWTHLWLNEGFASWIEYLCVDHCFPEYDIWTQFATGDFTRALELDALQNSHPIEVEVGHPSEVDEIFDAISYSKGASVIRMLHDYIGDEDFRKGMHAYLTRHAYKNTFTEDLWAALGEASGKPIAQIMSTWTKQMGFPVLKVKPSGGDGAKRSLTINQQKFTADGSVAAASYQWMVPISLSSADSPDKAISRTLLDKPESTIELDGVKAGSWIKMNTGGVGFYRTHYSEEMLQALLPGIRDLSLPHRDRLSLQSDLFALARAGVASGVDALKMSEAFSAETNFTVWCDLSSNLGGVGYLYSTTDFSDNFRAFIRHLFTPIMAVVGWDAKPGEGHLTTMLRSLVVGRLGRAGDQSVIAEARKRFAAHCDGTAPLPADLRNAVYSTVLKHGTVADYEQTLKLFRATDLQEEKVRILRSLGAVSDPTLVQRTLDFSIGNEVRSMDTVTAIGSVTGSVVGRELAWKFVQDQWEVLHGRYKSGFLLARLVKSTTENFSTEQRAQEVDAFFKAHPASGAERTIQQCLENIRLNVQQLERDREPVKKYLSSFK
jgi:puromycin-sensitive aminopeptidase